MRFLPVIILTLSILLTGFVFSEKELDIDADFAVFNLSAGGDDHLSALTSKYVRTVFLYIGELVYPEPYIKKVLEWKELEPGDKLTEIDVKKMGEKLEAKKVVYGEVKKSGNTYTVYLKGIDLKTNEVFLDKKASDTGEYSLSSIIDEIVGLTE